MQVLFINILFKNIKITGWENFWEKCMA